MCPRPDDRAGLGEGQAVQAASDLVGKTIAIDAPNTPAHIGLLRWLKRNGVERS